MKLLFLILTFTFVTSNAYALGKLEKGILIGVLSVPVIQHIFSGPTDAAPPPRHSYHYYHQHNEHCHDHDHYRPSSRDCIWVTRYHRATNEPIGYDRYCR